jgi:hypothetical protein
MPRLSDITAAAVSALIGNASLVKGPLAINAAGAATVKTTAALSYTVGGLLYTKAALAAQSIVPTHNALLQAQAGGYVQPIGQTVYYTLGADALGNIAVVQGAYDGQKPQGDPTVGLGPLYNSGTSSTGNGQVPDTPAGFTAFGLIKVVTTSATFTPGTTLLDAAGIAVTFYDVCVLPANRP